MPTETPVTGLLSTYLAACERNGWDPDTDLRMEFELSDEDAAALDGFTAEDFEGLSDLSPEELAQLHPPAANNDEVSRLKREAARRRTALKPWTQLARDFDMTVDDIRAILEEHEDGDDDGGAKPKPKPKDDRDDRRQRRDRGRAADERANRKIVRAEVKAAAADLFEDPADAALYLDLDKYEVDDDGDLVDTEELIDDLKEVLERKPHLAKAKERKGPKPLPGQGRRDAAPNSGLDAGRERARARFGKSTNGDS